MDDSNDSNVYTRQRRSARHARRPHRPTPQTLSFARDFCLFYYTSTVAKSVFTELYIFVTKYYFLKIKLEGRW